MTKGLEVLRYSQSAYRNAGVEQAYRALGLDQKLMESNTVPHLAVELDLHETALERFLCALCFLGLVEKVGHQEYKHIKLKNYSIDASELLFWMINEEIAEKIQADQFVLENKENIDRCLHLGLLEPVEEKFRIPSEIETYFSPASLDYLGPLCQHYQRIMIHFFSPEIIINALRSNQSQWEAAMGKPGITSAFDAYDDDKLMKTFMTGMHMLTATENTILSQRIDMTGVHSILDVGGGSGDWISKLISLSDDQCRGFIYELPEAIETLDSIRKEKTDISTHDRIEYIGGSFLNIGDHLGLENIPHGRLFDLISLCWILHDWNDDTCLSILQKLYCHLAISGKLVILEAELPEDRIGPACMHDMTMLLQTEGRERTLSEYKSLLVQVGFFNEDVARVETETRRKMIVATKR